jgi:uncharacterized membrane protein YcaP (DUF421 family)
MDLLGFDIGQALLPDVNLLETVVRGIVMYLTIAVLLRYMMRGRTSASMPDLLVIVLIADAAQNGMAAEYHSLTNGIVLVTTIIGMSTLLDWLGQHIPAVQRFIHPDPRQLIADGRFVQKELDHELMSREDMMTQLRLQGVERVEDVKASYLEGTGEVSVIKKEQSAEGGRRKSAGGR